MGTGHYPLLSRNLSRHWGRSALAGHIRSLDSWAPGFLYSGYSVPSGWAWGCARPSLGSNQGDLSPECRRQELPTGPSSVVHTEGTPGISVSKVGGWGRWRMGLVRMCKGKDSPAALSTWDADYSLTVGSLGDDDLMKCHLQSPM